MHCVDDRELLVVVVFHFYQNTLYTSNRLEVLVIIQEAPETDIIRFYNPTYLALQ